MRRERKGAEKKNRETGRCDDRKSLQNQKELECLEESRAQRWVALGVSSTIVLLPNESNKHYWDLREGKAENSQELWSITLAVR